MLALAFPERIGKARGSPGQFLLANGRGANLDPAHPLAGSPFLVAAELQGSAASSRILLAAAADEADILAAAGHRIRQVDEIEFDPSVGALRSRRIRRLDAILLANEPRAVMPSEETARLLAEGARRSSALTACRGARRKSSSATGPVSCARLERMSGRTSPMRGLPRRPPSGLPHTLPVRRSSPRLAPRR